MSLISLVLTLVFRRIPSWIRHEYRSSQDVYLSRRTVLDCIRRCDDH